MIQRTLTKCLIFFFLSGSYIFAQQKALSGNVSRHGGSPIEGLTVVLENNGNVEAQTVTDILGNYALSVNSGSYLALRVRNQDTEVSGIPSTIEYTAHSNLTITNDTTIDITMPEYVHISGTVYDADSVPLVGAEVLVKKWEGSEMTPWDKDISESTGSYSIYMRPGGIKLWITPSGGQQITLLDTITTDTSLDIILPRLVTLSGTVTNYSGTPLANISVAIEKSMEQYEAITDANGNYSKTINPGTYQIRLRNGTSVYGTAQGVPACMEETKIASIDLSIDTTIDLTTIHYPSLRCSVVNSSGNPVAETGLTSKQWLGSEMTPWDYDTTDNNGICTLHIYPGNNKIWVYPPQGQDYVETSFEFETIRDTTLCITIAEGASLSGKVYLADSTPVEGVTVALEKDMDQWQTTTSSDGSYSFTMQTGTYRLRVRNQGSSISGLPSTLEHTVQDAFSLISTMSENIYLPKFPIISGEIQDPDGNPVVSAILVGKKWDGAEMTPWDQCVSDGQGNYSLTLCSGLNKIWITPPSGTSLGEFSFIESFSENTTKNITIPDQAKGVTRIQPSVITRGNTGKIVVSVIGIDLTSGAVVVELGEDITASSVTVMSSISLTAQVSIDENVVLGTRDVVVLVESQRIIGPNLLTITARAQENVPLNASSETTADIAISDSAGTELLIPAGTEIEFPEGAEQEISFESPILTGQDPQLTDGELTEVQKELEPSGLVFKDTVYMTIQYKDQDVEGIEETKLQPYFYVDGETENGEGELSDSLKVTEHDTAANTMTIAIPHFSMFRLATSGQTKKAIKDNSDPSLASNYTRILRTSFSGFTLKHISFYISSSDAHQTTSLNLYDLRGRLIRTLVSDKLDNGIHHFHWDQKDSAKQFLGNGLYILHLNVGRRTVMKRNFIMVR